MENMKQYSPKYLGKHEIVQLLGDFSALGGGMVTMKVVR